MPKLLKFSSLFSVSSHMSGKSKVVPASVRIPISDVNKVNNDGRFGCGDGEKYEVAQNVMA